MNASDARMLVAVAEALGAPVRVRTQTVHVLDAFEVEVGSPPVTTASYKHAVELCEAYARGAAEPQPWTTITHEQADRIAAALRERIERGERAHPAVTCLDPSGHVWTANAAALALLD